MALGLPKREIQEAQVRKNKREMVRIHGIVSGMMEYIRVSKHGINDD